MTAEPTTTVDPATLLTHVLRLADDNLILSQRLGELIARMPELEEDIAVANIALDHLGQARNFYQYATEIEAAAGAAGMFKMVRSLHEKVLTPSLNFNDPNPNVDWDRVPFAVNTELRQWPTPPNGIRRGGVSAFGFGGTNFHVVLEEHVPGRHKPPSRVFATASLPSSAAPAVVPTDVVADPTKPPPRGALVLGGRDDADLPARHEAVAGASDFYLVEEVDPDRAREIVIRLVTRRIPGPAIARGV